MPERDPREWSPRWRYLAIKFNAGHDPNGNPRRGWLIVAMDDGDPMDFVDEGYLGWSALERAYPNVVEGPEIKVTPQQYRESLRFSIKQAARHRRGEI